MSATAGVGRIPSNFGVGLAVACSKIRITHALTLKPSAVATSLIVSSKSRRPSNLKLSWHLSVMSSTCLVVYLTNASKLSSKQSSVLSNIQSSILSSKQSSILSSILSSTGSSILSSIQASA